MHAAMKPYPYLAFAAWPFSEMLPSLCPWRVEGNTQAAEGAAPASLQAAVGVPGRAHLPGDLLASVPPGLRLPHRHRRAGEAVPLLLPCVTIPWLTLSSTLRCIAC
jgi:hypothetical protein